MSDIVERLRQHDIGKGIVHPLFAEAATEIETLRSGLKWMLESYGSLLMFLDEQTVIDFLNKLRTLVGLEPNLTPLDFTL